MFEKVVRIYPSHRPVWKLCEHLEDIPDHVNIRKIKCINPYRICVPLPVTTAKFQVDVRLGIDSV